jgi:hypothetical protein
MYNSSLNKINGKKSLFELTLCGHKTYADTDVFPHPTTSRSCHHHQKLLLLHYGLIQQCAPNYYDPQVNIEIFETAIAKSGKHFKQ